MYIRAINHPYIHRLFLLCVPHTQKQASGFSQGFAPRPQHRVNAMSKLFTVSPETKKSMIVMRTDCLVKEQLKQKADDCGLSLTDYLLRCGLGRPIRSRVNAVIINELRDFASLIKQIRTEDVEQGREGSWDNEYREVLKAVVTAIERIGLQQDVTP